ncbi:MAG: hypothetical protein HY335_09975, partial [Deinococcus sp.]|nr:hypothetical protein [Deinococcus sp.]
RLSGVVVGPTGLVYVAGTVPVSDGSTTSTVSMVDPVTAQVTGRILVGTLPLILVMSPDGQTLYTVNTVSNNISVVDLAAQAVTGTINVGERPRGLALSHDGTLGYVSYGLTHGIGIVDLAAREVVRTIGLPQLTRLGEMVLSRDDRWLYAVDSSGNAVLAIDLSQQEQAKHITLGRITGYTEYSPMALALAPDDQRLFVANRDGTLSVLEVPGNRLKGALRQVGIDLRGVAFTPDGTAYVTSLGTDEVVVVQKIK